MARKLIRITGGDRIDFLQNLVTNDVTQEGLVYTALLTPQGKLVADFFLVPDGDGILVDVDAEIAPTLAQRLSMYKLRADVALDWDDRKVSQGTGEAPEGAFADPRDPSLGWRAYGTEESELADWDARRVAALVPEWGTELGPDTYILEAGFERISGVDFKKGCYVGQEVTARMKHKTELQKGIARVAVSGDADPGDAITSGGKPVGELHTRAGDEALAYLRFNKIKDDLCTQNATLTRL
ncbi:MAG: folate-binding protein [Rhodobacteraceae bacterium]|nr:folate-binding protein [Paracoccaceae bacterium]